MLVIQSFTTYIQHHPIVTHASFQLQPGMIAGLIGTNGAGKTTIMKTSLGLTRFTGHIQVDQQAVTENQHAALPTWAR